MRSRPKIVALSGLRMGCIVVMLLMDAGAASAGAVGLMGVWLHPNQRIQVEIVPCGDLFCGEIVWFKWPNDVDGLPLADVKNPDPELRGRPLLGLRALEGLRPEGDGVWVDGRIYNPDDGVDYKASARMGRDGRLHLRVYRFLPILGKTLIWTRVE